MCVCFSQVTPDRGFLDAGESVELTIVTTPFQAESIKNGGIVLDVRGDQVCVAERLGE